MSRRRNPGGSYQVVVPGRFPPAYLTAFADHGVDHVAVSSVFMVASGDEEGVADIAAMLRAHGLTILSIRAVPADQARMLAG
jgi:hypothetical protein